MTQVSVTIEDVERNIFRLFASRGDLDEGVVGLILDTVRNSQPVQYTDDRRRIRGDWFIYLRDNHVLGNAALSVSIALFGRFATYEEGIVWLNQRASGTPSPRLEMIIDGSTQGVIRELRKMRFAH